MSRELTAEQKAHIALVEKYVWLGDLLTFTICMGRVREAVYTGNQGRWLCGRLTLDTRNIEGIVGTQSVHDIAPLNVTHINRDPVAAIPTLIEIDPKWRERRAQIALCDRGATA